jgi:hypothetical protein
MTLLFRIAPICPAALLSLIGMLLTDCARLPETTRVIHDDERVVVRMETDPDSNPYAQSTPTDIPSDQLTRLLRGFSVRPASSVPVRFLGDDRPPRKFLLEREIEALVPVLQNALQKVGSDERIRFEVLSPGRNPRYWRDVTGGVIKIRNRYFHLWVDYFHVEQPIRKTDAYDPKYPSPWTPEQAYAVYFEPQGLFVIDPQLNHSAVDMNKFLSSTSP